MLPQSYTKSIRCKTIQIDKDKDKSEKQFKSYFFMLPFVHRVSREFVTAVRFGLAMREQQSCDGLSLSGRRKIDEAE